MLFFAQHPDTVEIRIYSTDHINKAGKVQNVLCPILLLLLNILSSCPLVTRIIRDMSCGKLACRCVMVLAVRWLADIAHSHTCLRR